MKYLQKLIFLIKNVMRKKKKLMKQHFIENEMFIKIIDNFLHKKINNLYI